MFFFFLGFYSKFPGTSVLMINQPLTLNQENAYLSYSKNVLMLLSVLPDHIFGLEQTDVIIFFLMC